MIPFALNHLWQSTLAAAVAALLAWMLRQYPAGARFWLWMAASLSRTIRLGLAALALAAIAAPIVAGHVYGSQAQSLPKLSFDVASVHEWGAGQGPAGRFVAGVQFSTGRIHAECANLDSLIFYAYHLTGSEPLKGLPKWSQASCGYPDSAGTFVIEATMPPDTTDAQARWMMQSLLADRFKLAAHWESRNLPIYVLSVAPGRMRLKPSDPASDPPVPPHSVGCPGDDPHCHIHVGGSMTMSSLAGGLTDSLGRPVIDKTGLAGNYYIGVFYWAGDESIGSSLPSLPTLLRENFGLELKAETGPVPVLIIDHVEKPQGN